MRLGSTFLVLSLFVFAGIGCMSDQGRASKGDTTVYKFYVQKSADDRRLQPLLWKMPDTGDPIPQGVELPSSAERTHLSAIEKSYREWKEDSSRFERLKMRALGEAHALSCPLAHVAIVLLKEERVRDGSTVELMANRDRSFPGSCESSLLVRASKGELMSRGARSVKEALDRFIDPKWLHARTIARHESSAPR